MMPTTPRPRLGDRYSRGYQPVLRRWLGGDRRRGGRAAKLRGATLGHRSHSLAEDDSVVARLAGDRLTRRKVADSNSSVGGSQFLQKRRAGPSARRRRVRWGSAESGDGPVGGRPSP